jgi:hypothetical protein
MIDDTWETCEIKSWTSNFLLFVGHQLTKQAGFQIRELRYVSID